MLVYSFDYRTREFVCPHELGDTDRDPRNPDDYLLPGNAVEVAPPVVSAGQAAVWEDGDWVVRPDHRGETWWDVDGHPIVVVEIGDPVAAGLSATPPPPAIADYRYAIQAHIDATARERNYDSGVTCASYVNSTNATWAAEATAFTAWRDAVWAYAYAELEKVVNEERPQPTVEDFLAELPAFTWPS